MPNLAFVIGVQTKIYFTVMPDELLALPELTAPVDVPITTTGAIVALDPAVDVTALAGPVPAGTPIALQVGTGNTATKLTVYTAAHAKTGDTELAILPAAGALATAATGTYKAKQLLSGGTTSSRQIQNQNTETDVYQEGLAFKSGIVTGASWNISYTANALPLDDGYYRINYAGVNAIAGAHGYIWLEEPKPAGKTKGATTRGLVQLENFNSEFPAAGIVTFTTNFLGRGIPTFEPYV
jgi:hypothetical protein